MVKRLKDKDDQVKITEKILGKDPLSGFKAKMPTSPFLTPTQLNILILTVCIFFMMKESFSSFLS